MHLDEVRVYIHTAHKKLDNEPDISEPPMFGTHSSVRVNGLAIALDRRDGTVQWSRPMEQQLFRPHLPVGSGVLAYSTLRKQPPGPMAEEYSTEVAFFSRQTGEPLFSEKYPGASGGEAWRLLPDGSLQLQVGGREFMLTWKADPNNNPKAPEQSEPQPEEPQAPIKLQ